MGKVFIGAPNRCQPGLTVTGGSWLAALPAANVCDPLLAKVARSTNDDAASTKFTIDFGTTRVIRAVSCHNVNFSAAATIRALYGTTSGGGESYTGTLASWLSTTFESAMAAQGMEDGEYLRDGTPAIIMLPNYVSGRYLTIEVVDTANPDGYVQIGRVFAGGGFIPTINPVYGLGDAWHDLSTKGASESGVEWATARRRLAEVSMTFEGLTLAEGDVLHETQRVVGTVGEVLYVSDIEDTAAAQRYSMLGTLQTLDPLEYVRWQRRGLPLRIRQKG